MVHVWKFVTIVEELKKFVGLTDLIVKVGHHMEGEDIEVSALCPIPVAWVLQRTEIPSDIRPFLQHIILWLWVAAVQKPLANCRKNTSKLPIM